jgi:hypothetical protein
VWPPIQRNAPADLPLEDKRILAQQLTDAEMRALSLAHMMTMRVFQIRDVVAQRSGKDVVAFNDERDDTSTFREFGRELKDAHDALGRLATDSP